MLPHSSKGAETMSQTNKFGGSFPSNAKAAPLLGALRRKTRKTERNKKQTNLSELSSVCLLLLLNMQRLKYLTLSRSSIPAGLILLLLLLLLQQLLSHFSFITGKCLYQRVTSFSYVILLTVYGFTKNYFDLLCNFLSADQKPLFVRRSLTLCWFFRSFRHGTFCATALNYFYRMTTPRSSELTPMYLDTRSLKLIIVQYILQTYPPVPALVILQSPFLRSYNLT